MPAKVSTIGEAEGNIMPIIMTDHIPKAKTKSDTLQVETSIPARASLI
jgi:hypothetical protein